MRIDEIKKRNIQEIADSNSILNNGIRYFHEGRVKKFQIKNNSIFAKVKGRQLYSVVIRINKGKIFPMCGCPYPGFGCKHVVSVLYHALVNKSNSRKKSIKDALQFEQIIENVPDEEIISAFGILKNSEFIKTNEKDNILFADILTNKEKYKLRVLLYEYGAHQSLRSECSCRGNYYYKSYCEHSLALFFYLLLKKDPNSVPKNYESNLRRMYNSKLYKNLLESISSLNSIQRPEPKKYKLLFNITEEKEGFSISLEKAVFLKNGGISASMQTNYHFLKENYGNFTNGERRILDIMFSSINKNKHPYESIKKDEFKTIGDLELLKNLRDYYQKSPESFIQCELPDNKAAVEINIEREPSNNKKVYNFNIIAEISDKKSDLNKSKCVLIDKESFWVFTQNPNKKSEKKNRLFELDTPKPEILKKILDFSNLELTPNLLREFIENHYVTLASISKVNLPLEHNIQEIKDIMPKPRLFLQESGNSFLMNLKFVYGSKEVSFNNKYDLFFREDNKKFTKICRNLPEEEKLSSILSEIAFLQGDSFAPIGDPLIWLCEKTPDLISAGYEIFGQDSLLNYKVRKDEPQIRLEVSSNIDWFDLKADINFGSEKVDLNSFFNALKNNESYIKLSDGTIGVIPKKWLSKLAGVAGFLNKDKNNNIKASNTQIQIIESLLDISDSSKTDKKYEEIRNKFKKFKEIKDFELPKGLNGELRPYQKVGYDWLHFLKEFSFGGCLADDMGLGKTVQVLSLLLYERETGNMKRPSLIVVPTSLVFNWAAEIKKFTPSLSFYVHHGQDRLKDMSKILEKKDDLIITTYGTLRNDISLFNKEGFYYIILDESQKIKNPLAQNTKSVFSLKGKHRLVLTGTPIENNYLELWSQFAFLNPGFLGSIDYFKNTFVSNNAKNGQSEKIQSLKNTINPFILMRKKENVAKDLPEKQITVLYCEMNKDHRIFYESWKDKYRKDIIESVEKEGFSKSRFKILQGLIKMRQISNHPILVDESFIGESNKFNLIIRQIEEITSEGHKILLFSSFVKVLSLFKSYFLKNNLKFSYLDGSTRNRKQVVEEFQNGDIGVFLISLKAGGLGLNLTAADYVFIVDPWWNPAAEMQAIDRAHRIGQDKKVFVYKTITKDTVEEKILELQQTKLDMVSKVIPGDEGIFKSLNRDDLLNLFK